MFIAIIGTRLAGKSTVETFLTEQQGFISVKLMNGSPQDMGPSQRRTVDASPLRADAHAVSYAKLETTLHSDAGESNLHRFSFLSMTSPTSPSMASPETREVELPTLWFRSPADMLAHVTRNWRKNFVTTDLESPQILMDFTTRPFVLVVSVDAPLFTRYQRSMNRSDAKHSLEDFIREHDAFYYGLRDHADDTPGSQRENGRLSAPFRSLSQLASVHVVNSFRSIPELQDHIVAMNFLDSERLRPGWDTYFMQLASLASQRSNCMKRRVGAILVRNRRVVSTGYNGTPRGLKNCNEGGCSRCNTANETPDECLCLHAEENALLEAGRERGGDGTVLYCNTCPCLKCTIKIIQTGVKEVVYNLSYKVDDASAALFAEAGVILRRHATPA